MHVVGGERSAAKADQALQDLPDARARLQAQDGSEFDASIGG